MLLKETHQQTEFSEYVLQLAPVSQEKAWRRVKTTSVLKPISPHHRFHSTPNDLRMFMLMCELYDVPPGEKHKTATKIMTLLRNEHPEKIAKVVSSMEGKLGPMRNQ